MDTIPITSLTPESAPPPDKAIRAVVTLSWPYSSSTRQCALLLADPDFRLRTRKGQVRVRFTGPSAEAVAKARIGIGDEVVLALNGSLWEQDPEATRTPGRSVDGELLFKRKLGLSVIRDQANVEINVNAPVSPAPRPQSPQKPVEAVTPLPRAVSALLPDLVGAVETPPSYTYTSPVFAKRLRLSSASLLNSAYDPFVVGDVDREQLNENKWTAFGSGLKWRMAEKTPSPKKVRFGEDEAVDEGRSQQEESLRASPSQEAQKKSRMPPPLLPPLQTQGQKPMDTPDLPSASVEHQEGPSTPKIQPVQSPTLPMPSPFPTETRTARFGLVDTISSAQHLERDTAALTQSQVEGIQTVTRREDPYEDVAMPDQHVDIMNEGPQRNGSDTEPNDEITQDALLERHEVILHDQSVQTQSVEDVVAKSPRLSHADFIEEVVNHQGTQVVTDQLPSIPRTPEKPSQLTIGPGGTNSAVASAHVTPQSEKEKIMAQTFRSLFGFQGSPGPTPHSPGTLVTQQQVERPSQTAWFSDIARTDDAEEVAQDLSQRKGTEAAVEVPGQSFEQQPSAIVEEQHASELVRLPSEQAEQQPAEPERAPEAEVIELISSSEDEEGGPQAAVLAPADVERVMPRPDIRDSLPDTKDENLLAQQSQTLQGRSGIQERRSRASKLRGMVEEEPPTEAELAMEQPPDSKFETSQSSSQAKLQDSQEKAHDTGIAVEARESQHQQGRSELEVSLETQTTENSLASLLHERGQEFPRHVTEEPLYPSLPLSPSNSQSLQEMPSQEIPDTIPETYRNLLPPTPQLTQVESSSQVQFGESQLSSKSQIEALQPPTQIPNVVDEIPMSQDQKSVVGEQPFSSQLQDVMGEKASSQSQKKTPMRKSLRSRVSNVPSVISPWFSPKRSSGAATDLAKRPGEDDTIEDGTHVPKRDVQVNATSQSTASEQALTGPTRLQDLRMDTNGFSTPSSYFTSLSRVEELLNPSSQQAYGTSAIDVLAVVTDLTTEPKQAKNGPRDYYTILKIADHSLSSGDDLSVEIYRPWKATLPVAAVGDIILLRAFAVKSRKRQPYLLSTDASAWCVWRYGNRNDSLGPADQDRPIWAQRGSGSVVREEMKGAPVEMGDEERGQALRLREWWQVIKADKAHMNDANGHEGENGLNGHLKEVIAAKF